MEELEYTVDDNIMRLTKDLAEAIHAAYPEKKSANRIRFVEHLLPELLGGTAPTWALKQHPPYGWAITEGKRMAAGVCCVYYGTDPETGKRVALVQHRKANEGTPQKVYGAVGGFMEPREKFYDAMVRETKEELCDYKGNPIFEPKFFKYTSLFSDVGLRNPPMIGQSFAYELDAEEMRLLKAHTTRLHEDTHYRTAVEKATDHEITLTEFRPLEEIASGSMRPLFTFSRQHDVYIAANNLLKHHHTLPSYVSLDPASPYYAHGRTA